MQWFKHDSDATQDAKIKKLIMRYGAEGYAVYFHCIELIVGDVGESSLTFELEHDSEIIADDLRIKGDATTSGIDKVNAIMKCIVSLGLFNENRGKIYCYKILKRLDSSMTSNPKLRSMMVEAKKNHDRVMIESCVHHDSVMQEENRIEQKRVEEKRKESPTPFSENPEPEINFMPDFFFHPCKHSELWNSLGLPKFTRTRLNISSTDLETCRLGTEGRTFDEIQEAMKNYATVQHDQENYKAPFPYTNLINFLAKGVENYSSLEPFKIRKNGTKQLTEEEAMAIVRSLK